MLRKTARDATDVDRPHRFYRPTAAIAVTPSRGLRGGLVAALPVPADGVLLFARITADDRRGLGAGNQRVRDLLVERYLRLGSSSNVVFGWGIATRLLDEAV